MPAVCMTTHCGEMARTLPVAQRLHTRYRRPKVAMTNERELCPFMR